MELDVPDLSDTGYRAHCSCILCIPRPKFHLKLRQWSREDEESFAVSRVGADFSGISTGDDFYDRFCDPEAAAASTSSVVTAPVPTTSTSTSPAPVYLTFQGYPVPVIRDSGSDSTSGYFLNGTAYDDVAVLAVSSFSNGANVGTLEYLTDFQSTVENFLSQSKAAGKQRLVIDLTANGGGFVIAGYELFSQMHIQTTASTQNLSIRTGSSRVTKRALYAANYHLFEKQESDVE
ncbi:peptidase S41 family protein [Seiridium cupressi]